MLPLCSEKELGELLARKEEEWRALQAHRAQLQETTLQTTRKHLEETQGKLQRLQEDFVYNLQVLEERDRELERYDVEFTQARRREEAHQAEASELKIEVAKLKQALTRETRHVEELQHRHQLMLQEHHLELERIHSDKKSEVDHHQGQYESLKWTLERKLRELDGELALQRQELLQEFESEIQRKDHEFQLRADDMSNVVLTHELKVKLLNKELQALREAGAQATESLQKAKAEHIQLQRKLQDHALELQSLEAVKDARIKDLEKKLQSVQLARKRAEETFRRKNEELDRQAREKDTLLAAVKGSHAKQLHELEAKMLELQAHCETLEGQLRKAEWIRADDAKEKNALIDKLHEDAAALKAAWDAQITQMSKEAVSKDLQVQKLQEEEAKLKAQVAGFQKDIDRYKQQLSLAVEREQSLERDHVQLGLDWQRRCDDVERDHIQRSEALIRGLTRARDQVSAKLEETEKALHRQETLLKAVSLERDQAMETLRRHGLLPGQEAQVPPQQRDRETRKDFPSSEIQRLQEQNAGLRNAVAQMRREMELLSGHLPSAHPEECPDANPGAKAAGGPALPDHFLALEAEIQNLKHKLEVLEEQRQGVREPVKTSLPTDDPHPGAAVTDQACIALALRKLGDRVHLLNLLVTQLKKKLWQKPLEPVTVQHELPGEVDQVHLEVVELQKQVAELRKHVKVAGPRGEPAYTEQLQREDPRHTTRKCVSEYLGENQPHSVQVGSKCNIPRGYTAGVASRPAQKQHRVPTETLKSVCQKENRSPKLPPQAQEVPEESDHHTHRSSSLTSSSLQDTWKLLDLGSSLSGVTSQDDSAAERLAPPGASCLQKVHQSPVTTQSTFAVKGLKMEAQPKVTHPRPRKAHPAEPTNCWQRQRHPRIRNYNLKD
ncbi:coiled-coil domain-containing protein 57 isoform X4 [Cricetulus griseus]|uniref:Coiled-coil domain-containing protein 57 isoform X4 n=1 Tax=Cricetulus griseus TaxID=10029 RepID=A0A9J7GAL3_CRIGR|nr:coiled-coil domain-containing protein 57 isoform X4 [Cricetulus griseus]XP_027281140.1 coiled-coil domain-containing protein 57 isoform X4 [Cricetulus griseus]